MNGRLDLPDVPRSEPVFPPSSQELPSSPPSIASDVGFRRKPKKPPPVTPRSFRRFFTPRSMLDGGNSASSVRTNRQALKALSSPAVNRLGPAFTRTSKAVEHRPEAHEPLRTPSRKRKFSFSSIGSPLQSSPLKKVHVRNIVQDDAEVKRPVRDIQLNIETHEDDIKSSPIIKPSRQVLPVRRSQALQTSGALYMRSVTGTRANRVTIRSNSGASWQDLTSNFYSRPSDSHNCANNPGDRYVLPFCTAACNTNSLAAVGDEEGGIRLLDSAKDDKSGFSRAYLTFRPHTNSIMDLEFSSDDMLLATASGDQTALVIDMATQTPVYCLSNHVSSVKRVQFQPAANNKVLATCSRDGNVNIWDLRCKGFDRPSLQARCSLESDAESTAGAITSKTAFPQVLSTIHGAHAWTSQTSMLEPQARRSDITVTSLSFLPPGRENLFVTASSTNACVRLWDLRTAHNNRRGRPVLPLATTRQPDSHVKYRGFAVTSMALGGDGARLYTLCRDGTVYTYSTSHLVLGSAPELSLNNNRPRRSGGSDKEGLGPLYGFRHPRLQVATFYVKVGVRKAAGDKPEMLAAGSADNCAVLFPTDERFLSKDQKTTTEDDFLPPMPSSSTRSSLRRAISGRVEDTVPIYQSGTPLVGGHVKEVSAVSWTVDGELITVSDDYSARCWREGSEARDFRTSGEAEGKRWRCGWAETKDSYDDEDE
ncbi:WD40 repeat-like protein [Aspergillus sclerotioniger CBS 115572]|uniref:WD40 repeat-like protein n=1 Tax=Aspergillus sclerotioniger CBS 115572 TaxID=1450535 RepID=A0A317VGF0_9EURO|nr:WD40 repeat-like protein [Aspergillus sclerotioniger CBS 115572]PWY72231.1 WD40 repeat-like protein [Aspergillus sclerotioniger CBS 115572]